MRQSNRCSCLALAAFAWLGCALGAAACSSSATPPPDGGPGSGGAGGADAADAADAVATAWTCQQIRLCAFSCSDDACVGTCQQHGSPAAQTAFEDVNSCTTSPAPAGGACAIGDPNYRNCFCLAQCLQDPPCAATLDPCLGNIDDSICDGCA